VIHRARRRVRDVQQELPEAAPPAAGAPADLAAGDRVAVPHLGLRGQVTEIRGDKVGVVADGLRLSVDRDAVDRLERGGDAARADAPDAPDAAPGAGAGRGRPAGSRAGRTPGAASGEPAAEPQAASWTWDQDDAGIPPELDLRGLTADEAWDRVDRLIDRALPVGLDRVTIVHGMGPGRLREKLLARLGRDSRVVRCHPAGERQNNHGATVIRLQ
jgi:dsDNA-specific endonuclease/ATPase MutS2